MPTRKSSDEPIQALLKEGRKFPPPKDFAKRARVNSPRISQDAKKNPVAFWEKQAKELRWMKPWKKGLEWKLPYAKWFVGGKLNVSDNCLDRHVEGPRRNKAAIIWEGEPGDSRVLT
jgi:acetyl-CoA synthetase